MAWVGRRLSDEQESAALRAAGSGDGGAAGAVVEHRYGQARAFARKFARRAARGGGRDLDDVTQELALSLFKSLRRFRAPGAAGAGVNLAPLFATVLYWGFRSELNNMTSYDVSGLRGVPREPLGDVAGRPPDADPHDLADLDAALATLTPREAKVVRLYHGFDGKGPRTFRQVADEIGTNRQTACADYHGALAKLRGLLGAGV